jgi:zinc/manganese transport system ATP-binding protein
MADRISAIEIADLTVAYDREPVVHHLDGRFDAGSLTAVVGPNCAGKSTLLKAIVGILRPDAGRISLGLMTASDIAYLPQQAEIDPHFPITVADTIALGLWRRLGIWRGVDAQLRQRIVDALETVGLAGIGDQPIGNLSVGQRQRVLFARLLLQDARAIFLDEPFSAIDSRTTADLLALVERWHKEGRSVVAVLHDLDQVRAHFPDCLLLAREPIGWGRTAEVLTQENLARARDIAEHWAEHGAAAAAERVVPFPRREVR